MLPVGGGRAVHGDDSPFVFKHLSVHFPTEDQHRLDSQHRSFLDDRPAVRLALVGQVRIFVHRAADPVAAVAVDDAQLYPEAFLGGKGGQLERVGDVGELVARHHRFQPFREHPFGGAVQRVHIGRQLADAERPGAVPHPAVERGAAVNGDQVAFFEHNA